MKNYFQGKKKIIVYALFILLGVFLAASVFFGIEIFKSYKENKVRQAVQKEFLQKQKLQKEKTLKKKEISDSFKTQAEAFYVTDLETNKEIFSKNKNKKLGIASLTKIATSAIIIDQLKNSLDEEKTNIFILKKNLAKEGDNGLKWGEKFDWKSLLNFMMIVSSNDAASAIANNLGSEKVIEKMNNLAEKLHLNSTLFFSESGLDINQNILGSYSSASDIAKLVKYFYKEYPEFVKEFSIPKAKICSEKVCHNIENTNKLFFEKKICIKPADDSDTVGCLEERVEKYPYKILFSKTGYTKKSGGSIAMIAEISGHKILMVVLGSGKEARFSDIEKISKAVEKYFEIK